MLTHAQILDLCSSRLEAYGARPVPRADPDWTFNYPTGVNAPRCSVCAHPLSEHGAVGECWMVNADGVSVCNCQGVDKRSKGVV